MGTRGRERLVLVGSGMAGVAALEEVLKLDQGRYEITVFGAEERSYNRVLLSQFLTGEKEIKDIELHGPEWFRERSITLLKGVEANEIRRAGKVVVGDGVEVPYDKLVLATGSVPLVPEIAGINKEGVFTYRDLKDCAGIKSYLKEGMKAVVLGGGLLGLEAAYSLKKLGADVKVVHLAERIMERQLDDVAASLLKEDIERMGIEALLCKEAVEVEGEGKVTGLRFRDGGTLEADAVVVSIGIRPNAGLARASGLYSQRGIVVSDCMQTYDPAVFAVGECVEHRGKTFGLAGPVFEQARVLADHLAGKGRLTFTNRPNSVRLKVPSIELYCAGEVPRRVTDDIVYLDRSARVYKRIYLEDNRIKGVVMYGDTADGGRLFSRLLEGADVSAIRKTLLFGETGQARQKETIPAEAIVCGCNGVTKKEIVEAIEKKGLFTRDEIKAHTKASSSCGGCAATVERILEETLGSDFRKTGDEGRICGCTCYTRDDVIKNIREKRLASVREVMETLGWETVGCEVCRPAINYYLSMVWPGDSEDDPTSRLVNERMHANIQKDGTFSVVPRIYGGVVTADELRKIAAAAEKYNVPLVKITGGQRIALVGVKREDLKDVWTSLGMASGFAYGKALRTVKTCVGSSYCRYGTQDSLSLGISLEKKLGRVWAPAKVKMSVSGCPRNCSEASIKDIGIIGVAGGWEVYAGGCGGIELKGAERVATVRTAEAAEELALALLQFYREDALYGERTFKWIRRRGLDAVKKAVVDDVENRSALIARLSEALEGSHDPWACGNELKGLGLRKHRPVLSI